MSKREENLIVEELVYRERIERFYVTLQDGVRVWTWRIRNRNRQRNEKFEFFKSGNLPPLVLIHGACAASVIWKHNFEALAASGREVYAIDLPGFGLSDRVEIGRDARGVEEGWTAIIDEWRSLLDIDKMVLVGHSLGAYVSAAYLIRYSSRVERVFFCDPWGWATFNPDIAAYTYNDRPFIQRLLITFIIFIGTIFTPLVILRMFGKFGVLIFKIARPEMFELLGNHTAYYMANINMVNPTGEEAFQKLHLRNGYAKHPMSQRTEHFPANVPMHFLFGSRSWISPSTCEKFIKRFKNITTLTMVQNAGHQIYLENPSTFNSTILQYIQ